MDKPRTIQSLEIGFSLLRIVEAAPTPLALKDISGIAGMARSKAHLYLSTLLGLGALSRDASGRYLLGPYALQLGMSALKQSNVIDVSSDTMQALQAATGHSVHLSIWANHGPTIVKKLDSEHQVPMSVRVGFVMPLLSSSTGRVFLAYASEALTHPLVEKEKSQIGWDSAAVTALIQKITQAGYARSDGAMYKDFAAVAAPIFDHTQQLCAAIAVLDVALRMPTDHREETARLLVRAANEVSAKLGYDRPK